MPAQLDFKAIAEDIDIDAVARLLNLDLRQDRGPCPACRSKDQHALEILPESNSFRCWAADHPEDKKCLAGDCIGLYAHVKGYTGMYRAAKELSEHFHIGGRAKTIGADRKGPARDTVSPVAQKPPTREQSFDPEAFLQKLAYSDEMHEVASEEDAQAFRIGVYRGHLYIPAIRPNGSIAGWWKLVDGKLVPPKQWLPDTSNVAQFRKRA